MRTSQSWVRREYAKTAMACSIMAAYLCMLCVIVARDNVSAKTLVYYEYRISPLLVARLNDPRACARNQGLGTASNASMTASRARTTAFISALVKAVAFQRIVG